MQKITPKIGFIIFGVSLILLVSEIFVTMVLGVALMSESSGLYVFNILYFIIAFTAAAGILALICGILNKWNKINIGWKLLSVLVFVLGIILFFSLGGLETVGGRWSHYAGGGSYIGSNPVFSPDGTKIIFSSPITGHGDIYVMGINGSNRKRLTTSNDYEGEPVYSSGGFKICYVRENRYNGHSQIYIMDKDGNNQKKLTKNFKLAHSCSFSPNHKQVVFNGDNKICLINSDGSDLRCLNITGLNPVFFPDGKKIYYFSVLAGKEPPYKIIGIKILSLDINNLDNIPDPQVIAFLDGEIYDPKFSPDCKKIVYVAWSGHRQQYQQIFTADVDGTSITQLTNSKELKSTPSFSYDGSKIIFLSGSEGRGGNIMIMNNDGSGLKSIGTNN